MRRLILAVPTLLLGCTAPDPYSQPLPPPDPTETPMYLVPAPNLAEDPCPTLEHPYLLYTQ